MEQPSRSSRSSEICVRNQYLHILIIFSLSLSLSISSSLLRIGAFGWSGVMESSSRRNSLVQSLTNHVISSSPASSLKSNSSNRSQRTAPLTQAPPTALRTHGKLWLTWKRRKMRTRRRKKSHARSFYTSGAQS